MTPNGSGWSCVGGGGTGTDGIGENTGRSTWEFSGGGVNRRGVDGGREGEGGEVPKSHVEWSN